MEEEFDRILNKYGKLILEETEKNMRTNDRVVTGKTIDSMAYTVKDGVLIVSGRDDILTLEHGRSPTGQGFNGGSSAKGSFFAQIEQWVINRGLDLDPYAVYVNINKNGFEGTEGLFSEPIEELLQRMNAELQVTLDKVVSVQVANLFTEGSYTIK